ncbi:TonB-dependent receptor plug domain-containing protein [Pseudoduganella violaceinigra]|uniref:TonB-dependent receptor plug domain-containing protein n=1 Tax=Pseudoduganella violaceinigra TaxID=246602 RepID=UPI0003FE4791|nr:TonB-dependent receptor [Pseudoduganella violaceinigra]
MARIEVKAAGNLQQRRDDGAGRIIVSRDELARFGDSSVAASLRRQPGVTMANGQVQLRGLGGNRTQLLLNGEPAPPGFSPDSLAPELVERIEILPSASADSSAQGIAGSINIVLRRSTGRARAVFSGAVVQSGAGWSPESSFDLSRPGEEFSSSLALQAARGKSAAASGVREQSLTAGRLTAEENRAISERFGLSPRLNWKFDGGTKLAWQGLLNHVRNRNTGSARETALFGESSEFPKNAYGAEARTTSARSDIDASHRLGEDARIEWKAGLAHHRRNSDYRFTGSDVLGSARWLRHVLSSAADDGASTSGKLRLGGNGSHALAAGWDGAMARRGEWRRQEDADAAGLPLADLEQRYTARVRRLAAFVQDEWTVSPGLDTYLGLRWEGLRTLTDGRDIVDVSSNSGVWSPVAHVRWRLPDSRDQLRLALARSYKAPETRDLVPRRFTVNNGNGPANPDVQGNPALRPELAWGLDAAYERYFGKDSMLSISAYHRRIANVIQPVLFEDKGKWVATPTNIGNSSTQGVELDGRLAFGAGSTARLGMSRNWSHVDSLPGPGSRLGEQIPLTINAGVDVRFSAATTAGFNWNLQKGSTARMSAAQWRGRSSDRRLDLYANWQMRPGLVLRASASNALRPDTRSTELFEDGRHNAWRESLGNGDRRFKLSAEVAL